MTRRRVEATRPPASGLGVDQAGIVVLSDTWMLSGRWRSSSEANTASSAAVGCSVPLGEGADEEAAGRRTPTDAFDLGEGLIDAAVRDDRQRPEARQVVDA